MSRNVRRGVYLAVTLCMAFFLVSCGNLGSAPISGLDQFAGVSVQISPSSITVGTSTVTPFTATVQNSGLQTVQWQVNGIPGGAPIIGTIDSSGNYTAPQFVPNPAYVVITAIANADNTKSGTASVGITGTLYPATVYLSPEGTAYLQVGTELNLSAGVTGPADTSVEWQVNGTANGNATVGTIAPGANGSAVYSAPAKLPSGSSVTIKAISHAEPNVFQSCTVYLSQQPPTIATVTISPVVAVVQAGETFGFNTYVVGSSDESVLWNINGYPGGDSTFGTIAGLTAGGLYTAPFTIPKTGSSVVIGAAANAQPSRETTGLITIAPPPVYGVTVSISGPDADSVGAPQQYSAIVENSTDQTVTWQVNGIPGGNSTFGTIVPSNVFGQAIYTAPAVVPVPPTVVVGAVPNANPKVAGTLPVTISLPPVNVTVECYPTMCAPGTKLGINQQQQFEAQIQGLENQNATWYVCTGNPSPANCTEGGNNTLGTISPDTGADLVTYTAPNAVPAQPTVIIKAIPQANTNSYGTATLNISNSAINVSISPAGPFNVPIDQSAPPFTALVTGSMDQTVSWYVNNILNGNSTYGIMQPYSQNLQQELYIAPASIPSQNPVYITAVPEADPSVVSNAVQITITPPQQTMDVSPDPSPPLYPGASEQFTANVTGTSNQTVNWTLAPTNGGSCNNPNTPCGTINPLQTDNTPTTYTAPSSPPGDPYYVNVTATSQENPNLQVTVPVEITQSAGGSFSIYPPQPAIQAGSSNIITFYLTNLVNIPEDTNVSWTMSCNSLAPNSGENCGNQFKKEPWGPGCIQYPGQGPLPLCYNGTFEIEADQQFTYSPPEVLGSNYYQIQQCNTQPGQTDGFVAITATINENNCGTQGICTATVCINISPPAAK